MFEDKTMEIFSSRDMIRQQLITYAKDYLEMESIDLTHQSYLSYLINVLSVLTANLIYYNTATYREFFLIRAQQKESVLNLAAMIGYIPDLAQPAQAQILVSMPTDFRSSTTVVMRGRHDTQYDPYRFWADDIPFSLENEVQIDVVMDRGRLLSCNIVEMNKETGGTRSINWRLSRDGAYIHFMVNAIQVEDQRTTFTFPAIRPYEYYNTVIPFKGSLADVQVSTTPVRPEIREIWSADLGKYIKDVIDTTTSGPTIIWDNKASLFLIGNGDYGYTYRVNENGIKLFFGNGVIGTQPTEGDLCTAIVSVTKGYDGNVLTGTITRPDTLYATVLYNDTTSSLPVILKCINTSPATGGRDYPSIDEIRDQAIVQVSTNSRLVTKYDYDNAGSVVRDLPIQHSIPILKRSDLKRNEICMYTDLIFDDVYVPTRNAVVQIMRGDENKIIRFGDTVSINYNRFENVLDFVDTEFVSMFDIRIDPINGTCLYYYTLKDITTEAILVSAYTADSVIYPKQVSFETYRDTTDYTKDTVTFNFYFDKVTRSTKYDDMRCYVDINESGELEEMTYQTDSTNLYFTFTKDMTSIAEDELTFSFEVKYYDQTSQTELKLVDCQCNTILKKSLHEVMYSKVKRYAATSLEYTENNIWGVIYDVPVMLKEYLDNLILDYKKDAFIDQVLHRIVSFDVTEYRMLTDFVNLKFSNTFGIITNMNHNVATKGIVNRIDPETLPGCPGNGYVCAVTNDTNVWSVAPWYKTQGGFLARYADWVPGNWVFTNLSTNDIIYYDPIPPGQLYRQPLPPSPTSNNRGIPPVECLRKMIYNGDNLFYLNKQIPLEVELEVWKTTGFPISDSGMVQVIKNVLITHLAPLMGYDKPIYVSDITRVVQDIDGVDYCRVLKPEHDIFFNYDPDTFKHEDLLRYSPQLIYTTNNMIKVTLRKRESR